MSVQAFYDELAPLYHLVYENWEASVAQQGKALASLIGEHWGARAHGAQRYFGSAASATIAQDFTREQRREFAVRREILWDSESASDAEVNEKEVELIRAHRSNDPAVGYNRWPKVARALEGHDKRLGQEAPHEDGAAEQQA
jgi:hypothetical protein